MTRAFSRYKDSNPLRSARSRERIPIPCRVSYKTRYADRDARCVLSPHGAQDSLRSSFLPRRKTKEASTRHVLSTAAPQPSPKRSEWSRLCGAVHDISRSRACARERAFADAAGLWLCAVLLRHYACVCIYIYIYVCVRVCTYIPVAAFSAECDANASVRGEVQWRLPARRCCWSRDVRCESSVAVDVPRERTDHFRTENSEKQTY